LCDSESARDQPRLPKFSLAQASISATMRRANRDAIGPTRNDPAFERSSIARSSVIDALDVVSCDTLPQRQGSRGIRRDTKTASLISKSAL
jgi:hypothetical protein